MSKKISNIAGIIFIIILLLIFVLSKVKRNSSTNEIYFYAIDSIYEYSYDPSNKYTVNVYIREDIKTNELSFEIGSDNNKQKLSIDNLSLTKIGSSKYNGSNYIIYALDFYLLNSLYEKNCALYIDYLENMYKLKIGSFVVRVPKEENRNDLYTLLEGHYTYYEDALVLCGLSFRPSEDISVTSFNLGDDVKVILNDVSELNDNLNSSVIDIEYDYDKEAFGSFLFKANVTYYLPLSYKKLAYFYKTNIYINDTYYLDGIRYLITPRELNDYQSFLHKGEIWN